MDAAPPIDDDLDRALASVRPDTSGISARYAHAWVLERFGDAGKQVIVGRFEVHDRLGAGAFAIVYRARDPVLERDVALKILRPEALGVDGREQWLSESRALARVVHPNVVTVHEAGIADDQPYMVMELVDGQTLQEWGKKAQRPWREVVRLFVGIGRGLAAIHEQGIVHRDFKPANVLIDAAGTPRVADLGLARSDEEDEAGVAGTPRYMAPEQREDGVASAAADQYGFGLVLAEALGADEPRDWSRTCPEGIPRWLRQAVGRALSPDPEARWPSMDALSSELESKTQRGRRWTTLAIVVGLVGGAIGVGTPILQGQSCVEPPDAWSTERKARVRAALLAVDRPFAASTWKTVEQRLDAYADRLAVAGCDRGPDELAAQRRACVADRNQAFADFVDVLEQADTRVLTQAASMAYALPSIEQCLDSRRLSGYVALRMPERWEAVQHHLRASRRAFQLGDLEAATEAAQAGVDQGEAFGDSALRARAMLQLGHVQAMGGDSDTAIDVWRDAYLLALEAGEDEVSTRLAELIARHLGANLHQFDEGLRWADTSSAWATRSAAKPFQHAAIADARGSILLSSGRHEDALASFEAALAAQAEVSPSKPLLEAEILTNRAHALMSLGRHEQALADTERAYALFVETLGEDHPVTARPLDYRAWLLKETDPDQAERLMQRTLAIRIEALGEDHLDVAVARINLAAQWAEAGRLKEAEALYDDAIPVLRAARHPLLGQVLDYKASALHEEGRHDEADRLFAEAATALEDKVGEQHPLMALILRDWATTKEALGEHQDAIDKQARAVAILEAGDGDPADLRRARDELTALQQAQP